MPIWSKILRALEIPIPYRQVRPISSLFSFGTVIPKILINYCFCLCLGFEQIIRKCLRRLTILHLAQIFFTDDLIFIKNYIKRSIKQKTRKSPYFSVLFTFKNRDYY